MSGESSYHENAVPKNATAIDHDFEIPDYQDSSENPVATFVDTFAKNPAENFVSELSDFEQTPSSNTDYKVPASFAELQAEKDSDNLPPPYTLPYDVILDDSDMNGESAESDGFSENTSEKILGAESIEALPNNAVSADASNDASADASNNGLHETLHDVPPSDFEGTFDGNFEADFRNDFEGTFDASLHLDCTSEKSSHDFVQPFYDSGFEQEDYELSDIPLEDLNNHYEKVETDFREVHTAFSESAHAPIFPPHAIDLFAGRAEAISENALREYEVLDWEEFMKYCESHHFPEEYMPYINLCTAKVFADECIVRIGSDTALHQLNFVKKDVENFLVDFIGKPVKIRYAVDVYERRTLGEMMEAMHEHPQIQMLQKEFGASLLRCSDLKTEYKDKGKKS